MTTNFQQWAVTLNKQAQICIKNDYKIQQEAAQLLYERIVNRTPEGNPNLWNPPYWPADYIPGTLKNSWVIKITESAVEISNEQPYAERIETGYSTQAPAGMMRISVLEWDVILAQVARSYRL